MQNHITRCGIEDRSTEHLCNLLICFQQGNEMHSLPTTLQPWSRLPCLLLWRTPLTYWRTLLEKQVRVLALAALIAQWLSSELRRQCFCQLFVHQSCACISI